MTDYSNLLLDAVRCAQEAGKIHLSFFRKGNFAIEAKHNNESDIVTSADKAAEASIINFILLTVSLTLPFKNPTAMYMKQM